MLNILALMQYSFLNGFLLHWFFLNKKTSSSIEKILSSLLLSWCLNTLTIYALVRLISLPIAAPEIIIVSAGMSLTILTLGILKTKRNP